MTARITLECLCASQWVRVGNTATLSKPDNRKKLLDMYGSSYSANIMTLAVQSKCVRLGNIAQIAKLYDIYGYVYVCVLELLLRCASSICGSEGPH